MQDVQENFGKMPASMKKLAFKKLMKLINNLKHENNADLRVMLYTAAGVIVCDIEPCAKSAEMIKYTDDPLLFTLDMSAIFDELKTEFKTDTPNEYVYSDAYLLNAKDAVIYGHDSSKELMKLDQMLIFTDQIIGFTLISRKDHSIFAETPSKGDIF